MKESKQQKIERILADFYALKAKPWCIALGIVTAILLAWNIYVNLIAFSVYNVGLRFSLVLLLAIWSIPAFLLVRRNIDSGESPKNAIRSAKSKWMIFPLVGVAVLAVTLLVSFFASPVFNADAYRNLITVKEDNNFSTDVENYDTMKIAVVNKDFAIVLGDKKLGEGNLGSQYFVSDYTMSYYDGDIYWIGPLEYRGFFKWTSNSHQGSPGYIMISATDPSNVQIVQDKLKYLPSAYFGQDLERTMYFSNMGKLRDYDYSFELDDNGAPMFVQAVYKNAIAFTGGRESVGIITLNPKTGETNYYDNGKEPEWVDRVQPTDIIIEQLDNWGKYVKGFFNTLFARESMTQTSDGYNYLYSNGRLYLYTGITSVASDESIVGMILCDLKTKETNFYPIAGATEYAARNSAQGIVQDLGYIADFPTLINFNGEATYFMPLKDNEGLIKRYAYVNVRDYTKVGIGATIEAAQTDYSQKVSSGNTNHVTLTVKDIKTEVDDGNTLYLFTFTDSTHADIYKAYRSLSKELAFTQAGDSVTVTIVNDLITNFDNNDIG